MNAHIYTDGVYTNSTLAHSQRELILGGVSRASKDQGALRPPALKARRRLSGSIIYELFGLTLESKLACRIEEWVGASG